MKQTIVIGITSGIAGYKMVDVIKILQKNKKEVIVVMSQNAEKLFGKKIFEEVTNNKVYIELFEKNTDYKKIVLEKKVTHIEIADSADVLLIAPATANTIAKLAHGIADNFLLTISLATKAVKMISPSMNVHMWENQVVQDNIQILKNRGFHIIDPDKGDLACGYFGTGRLPKSSIIVNEVISLLNEKNELKGKKILITSGGTQVPVDGVRVLTNRSSGIMGAAIADICTKKGAEVILLKAKNAVSPQTLVKEYVFSTPDELEKLMECEVKKVDIVFHTAAVSDFIVEKNDTKLESTQIQSMRLIPTKKIIPKIKKWNKNCILIGFKAVYKINDNQCIEEGRRKLLESSADYIAVNDTGREGVGFESNTNELFVVSKDKRFIKIPKNSKSEIAKQLVEHIIKTM